MTSGSHQRRFLGFRLFASLLTRADAALVPALFSDGFSRCLLNNLAKKDNYLHAAADDCLAHVLKHAEARDTPPDVRLAVAAALQRLGPHRLDASGDKKNAVRELLGGLTGDDASEHARELMCIFARAPEADGAEAAEPGDGDGDASLPAAARNKRRLWALEQAVGLWPRLPRETQRELLEFLVAHAYYREEDAGVSEKPRKGEKKKAGGGKKEGERLASRRRGAARRAGGRLARGVRGARVRASGGERQGAPRRRRRGGQGGGGAEGKAGARARGSPAGLAGGGGGAVPRAGRAGERRGAGGRHARGVRGGPRLAVLGAGHARRAGGEGGEGEEGGRRGRVPGAGRRAPAPRARRAAGERLARVHARHRGPAALR